MPSSTTNYDLYKYNMGTDGNLTFNIQDALNDNWDILDTQVKLNENSILDNSADIVSLQNDVTMLGDYKQNTIYKITATLATTDFTYSGNVYTATITNTNITANTFINVVFSSADILNKVVTGIAVVDSYAGYATLKLTKLPTATINIILVLTTASDITT
jgi:hypothetical protein